MADFADELVKIVADKKRVAKKKPARAAISQVISSSQTTPASSSSPVGAKGSSSVAKPPPAKRQRDEQVIDLSAVAEEKGFVFPPTYGKRGFMEMNPPLLMQSEKDLILGYTSEERANMLAKDLAAMLRVAETAMALNEGGPMKEVATLKEKVLKLETKNLQLENSILDYEGKREIYAKQTAELRETNVELAKVKKELEDLRVGYDEEKKGRGIAVEELKSLQQMMIPAEDEPDCAQNLATRAELVGEIQVQRENVFKSAKYGFDNAMAQLQVVNPGLVTEGTGLLRKVENGQMEQEEEDDDDGEDDNEDEQMDVNEEGHGESDH
jgi:hypothetical protein